MKQNRHRAQRGFTLMELMMVVAIVGVFAGMAFTSISTMQNKTKANQEFTALMAFITKARNLSIGFLKCTDVEISPAQNRIRYNTYDFDDVNNTCTSPSGLPATMECPIGSHPTQCDHRDIRGYLEVKDFIDSDATSNASTKITFHPKGGLFQVGRPKVRLLRTLLSEANAAVKKQVTFIIYPAIGNVRRQK